MTKIFPYRNFVATALTAALTTCVVAQNAPVRTDTTRWSSAFNMMRPMLASKFSAKVATRWWMRRLVAVGFALAVVYLPLAGVQYSLVESGFMLIKPSSAKLADSKARFLDYREKAPAAASANMYLDAQGNVIPKMSTVGSKASGVPGDW